MKNNIYQFPQGAERQVVKKSINTVKRKRKLGKVGLIIMTGIRWLWFALRITLANMMHIATVTFFAFLHAFKGFIFVIGGFGCIIMYYHLDKHFTAPDNYTIPFFVGLWAMACAGEAITTMLHYAMPFHRLLAVWVREEENSDSHYQGAANDE